MGAVLNFEVITRIVQRTMAPLSRRVRLMVARGVVELVKDSTKLQSLQITVMADEVRDDVERFQQYGFSSVPAKEAECICVSVGGSHNHLVAISVDDRRYRPKDMEEQEVALYNSKGIKVFIDKDGIVNLGNKAASDALALASLVKSRLDTIQSTFDSHIHTTTATIGPSPATGVISPPTSPIGSLADVASSKVKAD